MGVRSLYFNIKYNEVITGHKEALIKKTNQEPHRDIIIKITEHILTLNSFDFNGNHYLQLKGCVMVTVAPPSYATNFMGKVEEDHNYPFIGHIGDSNGSGGTRSSSSCVCLCYSTSYLVHP